MKNINIRGVGVAWVSKSKITQFEKEGAVLELKLNEGELLTRMNIERFMGVLTIFGGFVGFFAFFYYSMKVHILQGADILLCGIIFAGIIIGCIFLSFRHTS
ncbi:MAG: hypothetical protein CVT90_00440 [Candidatus Altiarchaeales archaeon HGW-Altiarchaeales-3]|nr:MAG: hypothetical protein CVT90_00440 [Candidatus Altiarchaeales archaeon HGW-Altiarchaeales-3]